MAAATRVIWQKIAKFIYPTCIRRSHREVTPSGFRKCLVLEWLDYHAEESMLIHQPVSLQYWNLTDRHNGASALMCWRAIKILFLCTGLPSSSETQYFTRSMSSHCSSLPPQPHISVRGDGCCLMHICTLEYIAHCSYTSTFICRGTWELTRCRFVSSVSSIQP